MANDLLTTLEGAWQDGSRPADLYETKISKRPQSFVATVLEGLDSKNKRVQGGCAEIASRLSADHPELLYPHLERFAKNLQSKAAPILRWEAACTLGNLAAVDDRGVLPAQVPALIALLANKSIVLQGHAVRALAKIARKHPTVAKDVFAALKQSTRYFPGSRVGYVVEAMDTFAGDPKLSRAAREFLAPYADSEIAPVARKARKALRALGTA